jgi:LysM repeat protein
LWFDKTPLLLIQLPTRIITQKSDGLWFNVSVKMCLNSMINNGGKVAKSKIFSTILFWGFIMGLQPQVMARADGPDCWKVIKVMSTDTLSVRSGPSIKYQKIAKLAHDADGIQVTGTVKQVGKSFWVPIMYDEIVGWVNWGHLGEDTNCFEQSEPNYHVVDGGETLFSISQRYGYTVDDLARWNDLREPYQLQIGQRLRVSPPMMRKLTRDCNYRVVKVKNNEMLWIRAKASIKSEKIGAIPYDGKGIQIIGSEVKLKKSRWVPVMYKGVEGWVNRGYLEEDC